MTSAIPRARIVDPLNKTLEWSALTTLETKLEPHLYAKGSEQWQLCMPMLHGWHEARVAVFDRAKGLFYRGHVQNSNLPLADIHALQILKIHAPTSDVAHWEVNLVLHNGERRHLLQSHQETLMQDIEQLGNFLQVPLWYDDCAAASVPVHCAEAALLAQASFALAASLGVLWAARREHHHREVLFVDDVEGARQEQTTADPLALRVRGEVMGQAGNDYVLRLEKQSCFLQEAQALQHEKQLLLLGSSLALPCVVLALSSSLAFLGGGVLPFLPLFHALFRKKRLRFAKDGFYAGTWLQERLGKGRRCARKEIHALQVLPKFDMQGRNLFELNVVLHNARRMHVCTYHDEKRFWHDVKTLSTFLHVPVWLHENVPSHTEATAQD